MDFKSSLHSDTFNGSIIPPGEEIPVDNRSFLEFDESPPTSPSKFKGLFGSLRHRARSNAERSETAVGRPRSKTNPFDDNKLKAFLDTITAPPKSKIHVPKLDATKRQSPVPKIPKRRALRMGLKPLTLISGDTAPAGPNTPVLPHVEGTKDESPRTETNISASPSSRGVNSNRRPSPRFRSPLSTSRKENTPPLKESARRRAQTSSPLTPLRANQSALAPQTHVDTGTDDTRRRGIRVSPTNHGLLVNEGAELGPDLSDLHALCAAVLRGRDCESPKFDKSIKPPETPRLPSLWARDSLQLEKSRMLLEGTTPPSFTSRYSTDSDPDDPPVGDLSAWWKEEGNYYKEEDGEDDSNLLDGLRD